MLGFKTLGCIKQIYPCLESPYYRQCTVGRARTLVALALGPPWAAEQMSAPPWASMGCFTMIFSTGCRGISALVPGAPSLPPFSLTAGLFCYLSSLKYVITEMPPTWQISSALTSSEYILEPSVTGSVWHGDSSWCLLREPTLQPPCYQNLSM